MDTMNREAWLMEIAKGMEPIFKAYSLAPYRLTCGWPCKNALATRKRVVGECHSNLISAGKIHEIFISPLLADSLEVAGTVCHELAHIAAGLAAGHKGKFIGVCKYVGLTNGKPTTAMPGAPLSNTLAKLIGGIGDYPHKALTPTPKIAVATKDTSLVCPCGCKVRISLAWLAKAGIPMCGCGEEFQVK